MATAPKTDDKRKRRETARDYLKIGKALTKDGKADAARDLLLIARDLEPSNWAIVCALGDANYKLGRIDDADALWRSMATSAPESEVAKLRIHRRLSRAALAGGADEEAMYQLARHLKLEPDDAEGANQLLLLRLQKCATDSAMAVAEAHFAEFGRSPLADVAVAIYVGRHQDADAAVLKICEDYSVFAGQRDLALAAADALIEIGQADATARFLATLESMYPGDSRIVQRRIRHLVATGADKKQIAQAADSVVRHGGGTLRDRINKMRLLADARDWAAVIREAESLFATDGVDLDAAMIAIRAYIALERDEEVEALLTRCETEFGDAGSKQQTKLARVEIAAKRPDAAAERLAQLYQDPATATEARADYAFARASTGDYGSAWPLFTDALNHTTGELDLRRHAARCGAALGVAPTAKSFPEALFDEAFKVRPRQGAPATDTVAIVTSTLAAGGAERQVALTSHFVAERRAGIGRTILLGRDLTAARGNAVMLGLASSPHLEIDDMAELDPAVVFRTLCARPGADRDLLRLIAAFPEELFREIAKLYSKFIETRPAVVHLWQDGRIAVGAVAAILAGVPRIVASVRNVAPRDNDKRRYRPYLAGMYRALGERQDVVLTANSEAGGADYERVYGLTPGSITILRNGVDVATIRSRAPAQAVAAARARLGVGDGQKLVGGVFRLAPAKRPALWLEIARLIAEKDPDVRFVIVGVGVLREELERICAQSVLADRLVFAGAQSPVEPWIAAMDAMLLASEVEGMPNVVLESQSLGVPVVATDAGGTGEAILEGKTGLLARDASPEPLAAAVLDVLRSDGPLSDARRLGPAFIEERFGMRRMVDETMAVYGIGGAETSVAAE